MDRCGNLGLLVFLRTRLQVLVSLPCNEGLCCSDRLISIDVFQVLNISSIISILILILPVVTLTIVFFSFKIPIWFLFLSCFFAEFSIVPFVSRLFAFTSQSIFKIAA